MWKLLRGRTLAYKALRQGFYWLTIHKDSIEKVHKYDRCQRFSQQGTQPIKSLSPILLPISFTKWGDNIIGSLLIARAQAKFLIVGIDYFT